MRAIANFFGVHQKLCLFILSFLFSFILFYIFGVIYCDEVWLYGFSHNIFKGMIPYRDFNMVTTPLYPMLVSIFVKLFGNHIIVMHIFDSLLFASIIVLLFKIIKLKVFILLPVFLSFWPAGYNLLCLFFLTLIIYFLNEEESKDYLIDFIIGLCFITKQNIGIFLFLPCLFFSRNKVKAIICFSIPIIILFIYLIYNHAFYNFIDYCFLGMLDFGEGNKYFSIPFLIMFILQILILLFFLIRGNFKDKELFFILMFQLIMYPIFDIRHWFCSFFPFFYLVLKRINCKYVLFMIAFFVYLLSFSLFFTYKSKVNFDNHLLYLRNVGELETLVKEVKTYVGNNNNFFFTDYYNYLIKLYYDIPISQYDLLLIGNVGYHGMDMKLKELDTLCSNEKCYFFVEKNNEKTILERQYFSFYDYIINNYKKKDSLFEFDIYTN